MASLHERLARAREMLIAAGLPDAEAALDAELLARHVLECDRATLVTRSRDPVPSAFDRLYDPLVARRTAREPVAYILGHREFWGLDFEVTRSVLVPRPETELILEEAVELLPLREAPRQMIDVGTGSGCLAVALAVEFPGSRIVATDTSTDALRVARRNADRHNVGNRVDFVRTSVLDGIAAAADLIVSNPPYVPNGDAAGLPPEVGRFEPSSALYGGADGLDVMRRLLADAPRCLAASGSLVVEFGYGQEDGVRTAARDSGWQVARVRPDLQGIPRIAVLRR